jgi:hypothetical protein
VRALAQRPEFRAERAAAASPVALALFRWASGVEHYAGGMAAARARAGEVAAARAAVEAARSKLEERGDAVAAAEADASEAAAGVAAAQVALAALEAEQAAADARIARAGRVLAVLATEQEAWRAALADARAAQARAVPRTMLAAALLAYLGPLGPLARAAFRGGARARFAAAGFLPRLAPKAPPAEERAGQGGEGAGVSLPPGAVAGGAAARARPGQRRSSIKNLGGELEVPARPLGSAAAGAAGAAGATAQRETAGVGDGAVVKATEEAEEAEIEEGGEGWVAEALGFPPAVVEGWGGAGGLLLDPGTVEGAAIAARLARWPLLVDPTGRAVRWVRGAAGGAGLRAVLADDPTLLEVVAAARDAGGAVLVEGVCDPPPPAVAFLLATHPADQRLVSQQRRDGDGDGAPGEEEGAGDAAPPSPRAEPPPPPPPPSAGGAGGAGGVGGAGAGYRLYFSLAEAPRDGTALAGPLGKAAAVYFPPAVTSFEAMVRQRPSLPFRGHARSASARPRPAPPSVVSSTHPELRSGSGGASADAAPRARAAAAAPARGARRGRRAACRVRRADARRARGRERSGGLPPPCPSTTAAPALGLRG